MAARIRVSVLEGPFTVLSEVGVPLPVCISMQSKGLQLDKALWTARQSNGGFSVTFFWPALESNSARDLNTAVKKKRRRRHKKRKVRQQHKSAEAQHLCGDPQGNQSDPATLSTPIFAHQCNPGTVAAVKEPVDLTACENIVYEKKDEVPGVNYTLNGSETWTPVVKRKRRRSSASSTGASSSSSELDVSCSRKVQYQERNGAPGLSIHRRNVKWTPVIPSPVASRTRSRTKD